LAAEDNQKIKQLFLDGILPDELRQSLRFYLEKHRYPLFVRSSSLFEDSHFLSPAGMYSTYALPNSSDQLEARLRELCDAIKLVYSSLFFRAPKKFLDSSVHHQEEEKMAVLIQELAGQKYGDRWYYPTFSGVAQSLNYYPFGHLNRNDGIAYVALGLGKTVVEREQSLRFCPRYPQILPQFYSPESILQNSQRFFYALDLESNDTLLNSGEEANLVKHDLGQAEKDGSLKWIGSVLNPEDNMLRDSMTTEGTRIVSFSNILKWNAFPLAGILDSLLEIGEQSLGCPMEIEFAVNLYENSQRKPEFHFLQIRPMAVINQFSYQNEHEEVAEEQVFCRTDKSLGDGVVKNIRDIIFVKPGESVLSRSRDIVQELGKLNADIGAERPYMLMGPGRWGSADPNLGIPVEWDDISNVRVIVEYNPVGSHIEFSSGGHFFQNITSLHIGYLAVNLNDDEHTIDWEWLNSQPVVEETEHLKWVHVDVPVTVRITSATGEGVCQKPQVPEQEGLNEVME